MAKYDDARRKSTAETANTAGKALDKLQKKNAYNVLTPAEMKLRGSMEDTLGKAANKAKTAARKTGKVFTAGVGTRRAGKLAGGSTNRKVTTGTRRGTKVNRPGEKGVASKAGSKKKYGGRDTAAAKAAKKKAKQTKTNRAAGRVKAAATRAKNKKKK
tara:strand:- start:259 stop:732 length:474 start_codon:yes stop_codon:yes gene_type:complete